MARLSRLVSFWRNLVHRTRVDRELDDELHATFELLVDEKIRAGLDIDAARRAARLELGSLESLKGQIHDVRAGSSLDMLFQDIRYALRLFRRTPGFTAIAILTLALGIGANAAIFGVVKSVLLDALPYAEADRLERVWASVPDSLGHPGLMTRMVYTVIERQHAYESLTAFDSSRDVVYGDEEAARIVKLTWVQPGLFKTLGVPAALGRTFSEEDRAVGYEPASGVERGEDSARAVVISHAAWQGLFAADPEIIGREVRLNRRPRTVIGVLPPDFVGPMGPSDFFLAFDLKSCLNTGAGWLGLVGRLKPGMTHDAAQRDIAAVWAAREEPQGFKNYSMITVPLRDAMVGDTRTPLLVLLASAALVLLIACANLAGALLSRGLTRRKEFAVRVALGAARARLVRQLLTESVMLALAGGAAGLLLAQFLLSLLRGLATPLLPAYAELSLDTGAIAVTAVVAVCTGLAFGVAPALSIGRADSQGMLREDARGASEGRRARRLRGLLVAGQMALCASLLAGAGLLGRSLWELSSSPLGLDPSGVLSATFRLSPTDYPTQEARARFFEQLTERLRAIPGVTAAAIANKVPTVNPRRDGFSVEGVDPNTLPTFIIYASVGDDYFRLLRIPLRQGRTFDSSDREGSAATVVISETTARRFWPNGDAVGRSFNLGGSPVTVIGVVGDVRNDLARSDTDPMAYRSHRHESTWARALLIRTQGDPMSYARQVQRELSALDRSVPIQRALPLRDAVGEAYAGRRLPLMLILAFGALALLLASVGVYAMFASMAAAREREFGVRMALGSRPSAIAGLMMKQGAGWMAAGLTGGALGILIVVRLLRGWLYGVPPFDPIALGGALAMLVGCATIALFIPVRRATRVDPMVALRVD
jgi:putative ABC transport system permease protein